MSKAQSMKAAVRDLLLENGWNQDRWGHYQLAVNDKQYRMKLQDKTLRHEVRITSEATAYSRKKNEWVRIRSGYYGQLSIVTLEDGCKIIKGMDR